MTDRSDKLNPWLLPAPAPAPHLKHLARRTIAEHAKDPADLLDLLDLLDLREAE